MHLYFFIYGLSQTFIYFFPRLGLSQPTSFMVKIYMFHACCLIKHVFIVSYCIRNMFYVWPTQNLYFRLLKFICCEINICSLGFRTFGQLDLGHFFSNSARKIYQSIHGTVNITVLYLCRILGCVPKKDMQTPPPSEMTPSKSDCEWCAMFWIEWKW